MSLVINAIELLVQRVPTDKINGMHRELLTANGDPHIISGVLAKLFAEMPKDQVPEFMSQLYANYK